MVSNDDATYIEYKPPIVHKKIFPEMNLTGGVLQLTVPDGERWKVYSISTQSNQSRNMTRYLESATVGDYHLIDETDSPTTYNRNPMLPAPIILSPGWKIWGYYATLGSSGAFFLKALVEIETEY